MRIPDKIKGIYNKMNLQALLFSFSIIMITICMILSGYLLNRSTTKILSEKLEKIETENLKQINNTLISSIDEMKKYSSNLAKKDLLATYISNYTSISNDYIEKMNVTKSILSLFENANLFYRDIKYVELYTEKGVIRNSNTLISNEYKAYTYKDILASEIYIKAREARDSTILIEPAYKDNSISLESNSLCFGSIIYKEGKEIGFLLVAMQNGWLSNLIGDNSNVTLFNTNSNQLIWADNDPVIIDNGKLQEIKRAKNNSYIVDKNNSQYKINYMNSGINNWLIVKYSNMSEISKPIKTIRNYSFLIALFSMSISFLFSRFTTLRITKPIYDLIGVAAKYKAENKMEFYKSKKLNVNFKENVMLYFIIIVTMPVLLYNALFFIISSKIVEEKVKESLISTLERTVSNIDSFVYSSQRISLNIIFNKDVQQFLISNINPEQFKSTSFESQIHDLVNENKDLLESPFELYLFNKNGNPLYPEQSSTYNILESTVYNDIYSSYGEAMWNSYEKDKYNRHIISLSRKIKGIVSNELYNFKPIGFVSLIYDESSIEKLYRDLNIGDSNIYLTDNNGVIISSKDKSVIGSKVNINTNESKFSVFYSNCTTMPWTLVSEIPNKEISTQSQQILMLALSLLLTAVLASLVLSYWLSFYFSNFITILNKNLIKLGTNEIDINFEKGIYISEIKELAETFNKMAGRVQKTLELEKEKRNAEIEALQAQINPHFLYNTLESIKWMNIKGEKDNVSTMITSLGDIFRLGISHDRVYIPIVEEINYAKAYIDIQKLRYGSKLECFWHLDERVAEYLTPKLILQPLIENSIYHGLRSKEDGGYVDIYCSVTKDSVDFKVVDNGLGMGAEKLETIRNVLDGKIQSQNIGILNVHRRVRLYFGDRYGLFLDSVPGEGTIVIVSIPLLKSTQQ